LYKAIICVGSLAVLRKPLATEEEKKSKTQKEQGVHREVLYLLHGGQTKFTTLKVSRLCPLVLVKINWRQGRGVGKWRMLT
jgi:hypothetical protein